MQNKSPVNRKYRHRELIQHLLSIKHTHPRKNKQGKKWLTVVTQSSTSHSFLPQGRAVTKLFNQSIEKQFLPPSDLISLNNRKPGILNRGLPSKSCYHQIQGKKLILYQVSISVEKHLVSRQEKCTSPSPADTGTVHAHTHGTGRPPSLGPAWGGGGCWDHFTHCRSPYKLRGSGPRVYLIQVCGYPKVPRGIILWSIFYSFKTNWWMRSIYPLVWTPWF